MGRVVKTSLIYCTIRFQKLFLYNKHSETLFSITSSIDWFVLRNSYFCRLHLDPPSTLANGDPISKREKKDLLLLFVSSCFIDRYGASRVESSRVESSRVEMREISRDRRVVSLQLALFLVAGWWWWWLTWCFR